MTEKSLPIVIIPVSRVTRTDYYVDFQQIINNEHLLQETSQLLKKVSIIHLKKENLQLNCFLTVT